MRAIIFATGKPAELAPLSDHTPIPLLGLVDRPVLQHVVEALVGRGIQQIDVVLSHLPESIERFLGKGERWGCQFTFRLVRDSARPYRLLRVMDIGEEPVLIGHADRLTELPAELFDGPHPRLVTWNSEESTGGPASRQWTGWAVLTPSVLHGIPGDPTEGELAAYLFEAVKDRSQWLNVRPPVFLHTLRDYFEAHEALLDRKAPTSVSQGREIEPRVWLGRNVSLHPTARIEPPVFIGANSVIGPDVVMGPYAVVGHDCMLDARSTVTRSIVFPGSYVGEGLELAEVVVDRNMLVNSRLGAALTLPDPLLLGSLDDVGIVSPLQAFLSRATALVLLILSLPVLFFTALILKLARSGPVLFRHDVVRLPATAHGPLQTFRLWSFRADPAWKCSDCSMSGLLLQFLPALVNIVRGELSFVGLPPRSPIEVEDLPADWRTFYRRSKAGIVSDTTFLIGPAFSDDERFAGEAHYSCIARWQYDLRLLARYFANCLAEPAARGARDRRASVRHLTRVIVQPADHVPDQKPSIGRDISATGMAVESPCNYPAGAHIAVKLYNPRREAASIRVLVVCHSTTQDNGRFLLGCRFSREMSERELQEMRG